MCRSGAHGYREFGQLERFSGAHARHDLHKRLEDGVC
jgi:hypothetical protein